jgi:hypothetical protein
VATAAVNKFFSTTLDLINGACAPGLNPIKMLLTNAQPLPTNSRANQLTDIAAGNGYPAGGLVVPISSASQVAGLATLFPSNFQFVAVGGNIGPFRYLVLYDSVSGALIFWWDYGSALLLQSAEALNVVFDNVNGVLQLGP